MTYITKKLFKKTLPLFNWPEETQSKITVLL